MREEIEARPAVVVAIGLTIGLVAVGIPIASLFLGAFIVLVRTLRLRLFLALAFVLGLFLAPSIVKPIFEDVPLHGLGVVRTVPKLFEDRQTCLVEIGGRMVELSAVHSRPLVLGDTVELSGIESSVGATQEGYAAVQGIQGLVNAENVQVVRPGSFVARFADQWRRSFVAFFDRTLAHDDAVLVDAVCFGAGSMIDAPSRQEMKRSGLIHIATASGLQVFVLGFLLNSLLRCFPVTRSTQWGLLAVLLAFYCLAAGLNPAIVRASFMAVAGYGAYLFRREPDALSALAIAGIGYLFWSPHSIYNAGFQLSFIAVACVAFFYHRVPFEEANLRAKFVRLANEYVRQSAILLLATAPLTAYYFGVVSVVSMVSNLLVGWCLPLMVGVSFVAYSVGTAFPAVGQEIAASFVSPMANWVHSVSAWTGGDSSTISFPPFSGFWLVLIYGTWAMTYRRRIVQP